MSYFEDNFDEIVYGPMTTTFEQNLYKAHQFEEGIWTQKGGEEIHVSDMGDSHLLNCLRMMWGKEGPRHALTQMAIDMFTRELKKRGIKITPTPGKKK